eukprot:s270_g6.t1
MAEGCAKVKELLKFPFPMPDDDKAALVDLHHTLVDSSELKCKAITMKNVVSTPPEGVKLHSVRAVLLNFDLLDIIAPFLSQTLEIRKVPVLLWLFESVAVVNWKAWVGREGLRGYAIARTKFPSAGDDVLQALEKELEDDDHAGDGPSPQPSDEASPPAREPSPPSDSQNVVAAAESPAPTIWDDEPAPSPHDTSGQPVEQIPGSPKSAQLVDLVSDEESKGEGVVETVATSSAQPVKLKYLENPDWYDSQKEDEQLPPEFGDMRTRSPKPAENKGQWCYILMTLLMSLLALWKRLLRAKTLVLGEQPEEPTEDDPPPLTCQQQPSLGEKPEETMKDVPGPPLTCEQQPSLEEKLEDMKDVKGPPLTRDQQRRLRASQARGRGEKGAGRGRGRGKGKQDVVEDVDEEGAAEDLPNKPTRRARAKATPKAEAKAKAKAQVKTKAKDKTEVKAKAKAKAKGRSKQTKNPPADDSQAQWLSERTFEDRLSAEMESSHASIFQTAEKVHPPSLPDGLAILAILRLEPDSLGILAPVCSSMGFLASSISLRSFMLPLGDPEKEFVKVGVPARAMDAALGCGVLQAYGSVEQKVTAIRLAEPYVGGKGHKRATGVKKRLKKCSLFIIQRLAMAGSCDSLVKGARKLAEQPQPTTPKRGFSSGSAGGSLVPPRESQTVPPQEEVAPHVKAEPEPAAGSELSTHEATLKTLEVDMMKRLEEKMSDLETRFLRDLDEKKRKAQEEMELELGDKRRKIDDEIFEMEEERNLHETRLAIASEQLQERMHLVADEQKILDDLREKSRTMRHELESAAREKEQADNQSKRETDTRKELLRQKLEATVKKAAAPATLSVAPSPTSEATQPTVSPMSDGRGGGGGGTVALVSDQRFTSSTHPQAWHCLYRMTRKSDTCDAEIYKLWHEGGVMLGYWI